MESSSRLSHLTQFHRRRSYEPSRRSYEPNERTGLLDRQRPPPNADGYLDPDDPAVRSALSEQLHSLTMFRYRLTTCGRSALCAT
jgi:hypothetical protein